MRPLFGPARQTLGHPATTRYLAQMDEEEAQAILRERNDAIVTRAIREWFKRTDEQGS